MRAPVSAWNAPWLEARLVPAPMPEACDACGKQGALMRCSGCKSAHYCDRKCQKDAWKEEHKSKCRIAPGPGELPMPALLQMFECLKEDCHELRPLRGTSSGLCEAHYKELSCNCANEDCQHGPGACTDTVHSLRSKGKCKKCWEARRGREVCMRGKCRTGENDPFAMA